MNVNSNSGEFVVRQSANKNQLGVSPSSSSDTSKRFSTKFYYNSEVKPAEIDAALARRSSKRKGKSHKDSVVKSKLFWAGYKDVKNKMVRGGAESVPMKCTEKLCVENVNTRNPSIESCYDFSDQGTHA